MMRKFFNKIGGFILGLWLRIVGYRRAPDDDEGPFG
jgi:hypothetical protein